MKQLLSIAMLLFFMMGQVNLAWATHYCGDKLMSSEVSLAPEKSDCCGDEDKADDMGCCEDEVTVADADDFFGKSDVQIDLSPEFTYALVAIFFNFDFPLDTPDWDEIPSPDLPSPDFTILYQSFLI